MTLEWHAVITAEGIQIVEYETKILWDFTFGGDK